jgi:hypothetical protein
VQERVDQAMQNRSGVSARCDRLLAASVLERRLSPHRRPCVLFAAVAGGDEWILQVVRARVAYVLDKVYARKVVDV